MWLFRLKLMDAGGRSCAVPTTDLCNDMKINTCGENSTGRTGLACIAAAMRTTLRTTQRFPSEWCFQPFLLTPRVKDEGRMLRRGKEESKKQKKKKKKRFQTGTLGNTLTYFTDGVLPDYQVTAGLDVYRITTGLILVLSGCC